MKTCCVTQSFMRKRLWAGLLLVMLTCMASVSFAASSFVVGLPGVQVVDTKIDSFGTTYVLGKDGAGESLLIKYDSSGSPIAWVGGSSPVTIRTNTLGTPTALCVAAGTTNLYIVGSANIIRVSRDSGLSNTTPLPVPASMVPNAVYYSGGLVYICGNYIGSGGLFGKTANARGSQSAVLAKLPADLNSSSAVVVTYGGGSGLNTAESLAVDEAGDVYVSGHFGSGSLTSDTSFDGSGQWRVDVVSASVGISDIYIANAVLGGAGATSTNTSYWDKINFGSGSDGGFGGDAPFPNGVANNFVLHATGEIYIPSDGVYTFSSSTDDGTSLSIDGTQVLVYTGSRGVGTTTGAIFLTRGLHFADYIQFQGGGATSAELLFTPPGSPYVYWLQPTKLRDTQNKAYVAKFDGGLTVFKNAYFTASETPGSGGAFHELQYAQGWVYAVGSWQGVANNPDIGLKDTSVNGSTDIDIVKLDTDLKLKGRATVKGSANNEGYSVSPDDNGNIYVVGSYGPGSVDFTGNGDRSSTDPTKDRKFTSLSSPQTSLFVAQLNSNLDFQWVNQPTSPIPGSFSTASKVRWNSVLQRLFWTGFFANGSLTLGQPTTQVTLNGTQGFLTVLQPDGTFTERVLLTVISDYGNSVSQIKPFGGPLVGGNPTSTNQQYVIKGVPVTASVPKIIFRKGQVDVISDDQADTRISNNGYSVDNNVATGNAESYTFTITKDTSVTFNWQVDYALNIDSDLSGTVGTGDPAHGLAGISGISSLASGNPVPSVQKHWVAKSDTVIATIDSETMDLNNPGLPIKYVVTGYSAAGPANPLNSLQTNFISFSGNEVRRQVPQFVMNGPASIQYRWKLKIGVQVNTTGPQSSGWPLVKVLKDPGQTNSLPPAQSNGTGSGTFYFDEHTSVDIGTLKNQGVVQVKGWLNGDGYIFANTGALSNLTSSFTVTTTNGVQTYVSTRVPDLVRPGRVMWDYGDRIFEETVYIGNSVTFSTVDDPAVKAILRSDLSPDHVDVSEGPQGSTGNDMGIWDPQGKKYYPLRPGVVLSYWFTSGDPAARVIIRLTFKYPVSPHYRHIAGTPAVNLDPSTNDLVSFNSLKYTEPTTSAAVDSSNNFTATGPGNTVLLFNETSSSGRGGQIQTYRVRVVQTKKWNDQLPATQVAYIGQKITSAYDTAGLGTGYLFFKNARYNPFIYNRDTITGPIIPVNLFPTAGPTEQLVVVWYENRDKITWPYQAVQYTPAWPTPATGLNRIVLASRYGNESVAADGTDQIVTPAKMIGTNVIPVETTFNPARFQQLKIYNQPDSTIPGYNPNEEHALLAPSLRSAAISPRPMAAYALRDNDLNVTNRDASYTSDPYVLVQFFDALDQEFKMKVYNIVRAATNLNAGDLSYEYSFNQEMNAGEPVIPFYPLVSVIGATPSAATYGRDGQPTAQRCFWKDHKGTGWAVSGDGFFYMYFYYPLSPDFWWPAADNKQPGDSVAWLSNTPRDTNAFFNIDYTRNDQNPTAQKILYTTSWPQNVPVLKVGETLTFPGGEYHADNPITTVIDDNGDLVTEDTPGLPGVVGWAAGEIIYDTLNPVMNDQTIFDRYTARLFPALEERTVDLPVNQFPDLLLPANKRTQVKNGNYAFVELPSSLQKRVYYDPLRAKLVMKGFLNDKDIADSTLTASPPAVYVLEPNVLTLQEKAILDGTAAGSPFADLQGGAFALAMDTLFDLCRNPNQLDKGSNGVDQAYRVGLEQKIKRQINGLPITQTNSGIVSYVRDASKGAEQQALGPGLALVANPAFLDPNDSTQISYVTVAENNSDSLGSSPVVLHIVKVDKSQRYRGAIKTILSDNVFDENIVLRHTADFGGNADDLVFEWWYRPEDGTTALTPDRQGPPSPWKLFADPSGNLGNGFYQLTLKGNPSAPEALLADTLFFVRYRHKNEVTSGVNWEVPQPNGESRCVLNDCKPGIPYDWAGAGNSTPQDLNQDGLPDYKPQLAEGWIKRVLDAVNPYEARINDFTGDSPATYSSMIEELGARYEGPVALNPDKNVIENVGLIALYETILQRGRGLSIDLSTPVSTPAIANALELASTRLGDFYMLLGNEAYSDSQNPTIGYGSDSVQYGSLAPSVFAFQNQVSSLLEEELALLRGQDDNKAAPVYNRLFWNFTKGEGEAAYAMKYNISDMNKDGFIDENDAMILYPQGHGDAWGHYLSAIKMQYELLRQPYFNWVSRSEFYNLQDIVIPVDFLDERKFAQIAAAKAKAGSEIVNLTYRDKYVADPNGQWQGYTDTDKTRAWGVEEWARRAGQGAYFDWISANSLLPAVHPNTNYTGIQKVDRTTVQDIVLVSASLQAIQTKVDEVNNGNNPLGLENGSLSFDIDPPTLDVTNPTTAPGNGQTLFDQMYQRALAALGNAKITFDNANQLNNLIRQVANSQAAFQDQVYQQDVSYRNQLIEIFGTPYDGTIGSGKAYPAGYQGPDTMLYMYVDVNNVNDSTVPQPPASYYDAYKNQITGDAKVVNGVDNSWKTTYNLTFLNENQITNSINYSDFSDTNSFPLVNQLQNLNLPIMASGYTYTAPSDWGSRQSPGALQDIINQMVQAQADLNTAISDWDGTQYSMISSLQMINAKFDYNQKIRDNMKGQIAYDSVMGALGLTFKSISAVSELSSEIADGIGATAAMMFPTTTPTVGLAVSLGDALAPARGAIKGVGFSAKTTFIGFKLLFDKLADGTDLAKSIGDSIFALEIDGDERDLDLIQNLSELQINSYNESSARVVVFKQVQVLSELSDQYRSKLAEGFRLMEERTAYNQRVAAQTQKNRYQDMTFRVSRNAALEKYRSAFDLAARYTYLAGTAFDYDTNLGWDDAGSPADILTDIVRQRTIGLIGSNGQPAVGAGGLAEDLAKLQANYQVLKTRLGINNPQIEEATFSIRSEALRILSTNTSDATWVSTLRNSAIYKSDLWQVPEYRRFCRPFSSATNGAQPGLVITFSTQIRPNKNFFGWPLGGKDSSYDPSVYATRISSAGVWFSGYDTVNLPQTPRVYLIPIGQDIMTVPTSPDLAVRLWDVVDQNIPVPYPADSANLNDPTYKPLTDSLSGSYGDIRRFSSFRAFGFDHSQLSAFEQGSLIYNARLTGRSAWNTKWMLIIPGATFNADPTHGLDLFINSVKDIKLIFNTYGYSGN